MSFERALAEWLLLTLFFALVAGGTPWRFPAEGRYWLDHHLKTEQALRREAQRR